MKIDGIYTSDKDSWRDLSRQYYGHDAVIKLDEGYIDFSRDSYDRIHGNVFDFTYPMYLKIQRQCRSNEPVLASLFFQDEISCVIVQGKPGRQNKNTLDLNEVLLYTVSGKDEIHARAVMDSIRIMDEDHTVFEHFHKSPWITVMGYVCRYLEKNRNGYYVMHYGILPEKNCIHTASADHMMPCHELDVIEAAICRICPLARDCANSPADRCIADSSWYRKMSMQFLRIYLSEREVDDGTV